MWICIAPCREHTSKALRCCTRSQGISQLYLHSAHPAYIRYLNEPYQTLPSQLKLVLIDRPRRDGRLKRLNLIGNDWWFDATEAVSCPLLLFVVACVVSKSWRNLNLRKPRTSLHPRRHRGTNL